MVDEIRIEYEGVEAIANRFSEEAERTSKIIERLSERVNKLRSKGWVGKDANRFYGEYDDEILPALIRLQMALQEGESLAQKIIDLFSNAEEQTSDRISHG